MRKLETITGKDILHKPKRHSELIELLTRK